MLGRGPGGRCFSMRSRPSGTAAFLPLRVFLTLSGGGAGLVLQLSVSLLNLSHDLVDLAAGLHAGISGEPTGSILHGTLDLFDFSFDAVLIHALLSVFWAHPLLIHTGPTFPGRESRLKAPSSIDCAPEPDLKDPLAVRRRLRGAQWRQEAFLSWLWDHYRGPGVRSFIKPFWRRALLQRTLKQMYRRDSRRTLVFFGVSAVLLAAMPTRA